MTASSTDSQSIDRIGAVQPASASAGSPRAPGTSRRRRAFESRDRVHAAASAMAWILWILVVLLMAAFLAFAPSMLSAAHAQDSGTAMPPSAPLSLTATTGDQKVVLTWEAPVDDGGTAVTAYQHRHAEGTAVPDETAWTSAGLALTATVSGLENGTAYTFEVRAENSAGEGEIAATSATPATVPGPPQNLRATSGSTFLVVDWDAPASDGGASIAEYQYRYVAGSTVPEETAWTGPATKPLTFTGLTNGTAYTVDIRAVNSAGEGPLAAITAVPGTRPGAPQNLTATPGDGQATLTWEAPVDDGGAAIVRYDYAYPEDGTFNWVSVGTDMAVTVENLTNGTQYAFHVRAVNGVGEGAAAVAAVVPDEDPVITVHPEQADYRFAEGASDAGVVIVARTQAGKRRPSRTFRFSVVTRAVSGGATSPEDFSPVSLQLKFEPAEFGVVDEAWVATKQVALAILEDDVSEDDERFEVRLQPSPARPSWLQFREADKTTACGTGGCLMTVTIAANGPPSAPLGLSAEAGDGEVTLTWEAPSISGGTIAGYQYRSAEGISVPEPTTWTSAGTAFTVTVGELTNGTTYAFEVRAVNADGEGEVASVTATAEDPATVPGVPRNLSATPRDGEVTLTWKAPADDGGSPITGYQYRHAPGSSVPEATAWTTLGSALTVTVDGLDADAAYAFEVRAVNAEGRGAATGTTAGVPRLPTLSVRDAQAREGVDRVIEFAVALSRRSTATVTVDYATADGSAKAGEDYTRTGAALTFLAGETEKVVAVPVLDDVKDEGEETFTFTLTNAAGARIVRAVATGTIVNNDDAMPAAWLVRFGRTIAGQVVDALGDRFDGTLSPRAIVAGIPLGPGAVAIPPENPRIESLRSPPSLPEERRVPRPTMRDVALGSSFHLTSSDEAGGGTAVSLWGRAAAGGFAATVDGTRMKGDVTTGLVGVDADFGDVVTGVAFSRSEGRGSFAAAAGAATNRARGVVESTMTGAYPYARLRPNDRVSVWGLAGLGTGDLVLTEEGGAPIRTDTSLALVALGAQGSLVPAREPGNIALTLKSDGFWVRTTSDAVRSEATGNLESSAGESTRVRLALEGERVFALDEGETLTPRVALAVRGDGGDAETGVGLELGAGVRFKAPGVTVEAAVRTLLAHEASGLEEWSAGGAVRIDPGPSQRGLSLTLAPSVGGLQGGAGGLWSQDAPAQLVTAGAGDAGSRIDGELGYGLRGPDRHGVITPYAGLSVANDGSRTERVGTRWALGPHLTLGLEANRIEPGSAQPAHALVLRVAARW